jgi:uncharacterized protein (DUF302 family)
MAEPSDPKKRFEPTSTPRNGVPAPLPGHPGDGAERPGRTSHPAIPLPATATAIYGLVRQKSPYTVPETARRLMALVQAGGLQIFGDIDFAGDAGRAGVSMRPMRQLVFGGPRVGTPLVIAAPTIALDLPLRVLIFEDGRGAVWIAYNDAEYLRERHQLPDALLTGIGVIPELVARAVSADRV